MSDAIVINEFMSQMCLNIPTRGSQSPAKGINEWDYAETAAFLCFRNDFLNRNKGGLVINQTNYQTTRTSTDPATNDLLDSMQVYFRNWWSPRNVSREGGFRKPDGLGIAPGGQLVEIIEVKPVKNYDDGVSQLNEMIQKIKDGAIAYTKEFEIQKLRSPFLDANNLRVIGSPWKPSAAQRSIPLPDSSGANEICWICFNPTLRPLKKLEGGPKPIDGVILYEIHTFDKQRAKLEQSRIPKEVAKRLFKAHSERVSRGLSLTPWAQDYARKNPTDMDELAKILGYVGIALAIVVVAAVIIEAAPLVLAAGAESAIAAETVEVVVVQGGYRVAPVAVRIAASEAEAAASADELMEIAQSVARARGLM